MTGREMLEKLDQRIATLGAEMAAARVAGLDKHTLERRLVEFDARLRRIKSDRDAALAQLTREQGVAGRQAAEKRAALADLERQVAAGRARLKKLEATVALGGASGRVALVTALGPWTPQA